MESNKNKLLQVVITVGAIIFIFALAIIVVNENVDLKSIFSKNINYTSEKEVTVTDKGIADAVDKLYDATVIVEVGTGDTLSGWGSGVVYKTDEKFGYILTNHHVVNGADKIRIVFTDETETDATLVGSDTYADIAVVKVDAKYIKKVAEIGSSDDVQLGDTVFAIGTPVSLQYAFTVTRGILSGKNRLVEMKQQNNQGLFSSSTTEAWYMNLLQIDASINSGNSGGPLANSNGELIGINNSKLSSSSSLMGSSASIENMGFSIPIEMVMNVAKQLEEKGKVTRPFLGVSLTTIEGASHNGIDLDENIKSGAVIASVEADSACDEAGIKKGDVITKMDDKEISNYKYLKYYLYRYNVGDKVKFTIIRDGKEKVIEVTLKSK